MLARPKPEPVRRPAKVAQQFALAHHFQAAIERGLVADQVALARKLGLTCAQSSSSSTCSCWPLPPRSRFAASPIVIPSLRTRDAELPRILQEVEREAHETLHEAVQELAPEDRAWLLRHAVTSLPELEKATLRLLALRTTPSLAGAAARLGMAPVSLRRWLRRRNLEAVEASTPDSNVR